MRIFTARILTIFIAAIVYSLNTHQVQSQLPEYEKNGRIALAVVKEVYQDKTINQYKYGGRKQKNDTVAEDSFLFYLKSAKRMAIVQVTHNTKTNELISLTIKEQFVE